MSIQLPHLSQEEANHLVQQIHKQLKKTGSDDLKLSTVQEIIAQTWNCKNWNTFCKLAQPVHGSREKNFGHFGLTKYDSLKIEQAIKNAPESAISNRRMAAADLYNVLESSFDQNAPLMAPYGSYVPEDKRYGSITHMGEIVSFVVTENKFPVLITQDWAMEQDSLTWANAQHWREFEVVDFLESDLCDLCDPDTPVYVMTYGMVPGTKSPDVEFVTTISHVAPNGNAAQICTTAFVMD